MKRLQELGRRILQLGYLIQDVADVHAKQLPQNGGMQPRTHKPSQPPLCVEEGRATRSFQLCFGCFGS